MPLLFKHTVFKSATLAVWKVTEDEDFFLKKALTRWDDKELAKLKGGRRLEWIASRYLIQLITPGKYHITKDAFGKPQLSPPDYQISISHSHGYVAAIYSSEEVGIDIQKKVLKIDRIAHKFIGNEEEGFINNRFYLSNLHVIWGAKECLFKAYGRKEVDFKKDLLIHPFVYRKSGEFSAQVIKKGYKHEFICANRYFKNFYLVYCERTT